MVEVESSADSLDGCSGAQPSIPEKRLNAALSPRNCDRSHRRSKQSQLGLEEEDARKFSIPSSSQSLRCPECKSPRVWKDGLRRASDGDVQRYFCRDCGVRFSWPQPLQKKSYCHSNKPNAHRSNRQVCELLTEESKNLAEVPRTEIALREGTPDTATVKGLIVQFAAWLEKEGYAEPENKYLDNLRILIRRGANILDPESIKTTIARLQKRNGQPWKDGAKIVMVHTYNLFAQALKIKWEPPKYKQEEIEPFTPDETELDQLIASSKSKRMAAFLQCLKETYADPGEILPLEWTDINGNIITINHPVKGHRPGQHQVSARLLMMINNLPRKSERIFPTTYKTMYFAFELLRRRTAMYLQNPRMRKISFRSFRHWGGTMLAYRTNGNTLIVQKLLRHKSILSTMKYIGKITWKNDEYDVATATTVEEIKHLAEAGFEKFDEFNGIHVFRKHKVFKICS